MKDKTALPSCADEALTGRDDSISAPKVHFVNHNSLQPPFPPHMQQAVLGMGCFWGAERLFWEQKGVYVTAVGYAGGFTPNPLYQEVCSGRTGHAEVVKVVFDPHLVSYRTLLQRFWEGHDPTQGMRQGNDVGTQYRSVIQTFCAAQQREAEDSRRCYRQALEMAGLGLVTTDIQPASDFYYAEDLHQQYLAKNPGGYCGLGGTGIPFPVSASTA